jgi:NAD(P)-dependent dehydrogenase (short-subunit alcohol dehydrogenase family)
MEDLKTLGISTIALDVTDIEAIRQVRARISQETGGKLDILVNNASVWNFKNMDPSDFSLKWTE